MSRQIQTRLDAIQRGRFAQPRLIGRGSMGMVFRVRDGVEGVDLAFKLMAPSQAESPDHRRRFMLEAELLSRLEHPAFPDLVDVREDPAPMFLMEFIDGVDLQQVVRRDGPRPAPQVRDWLIQAAKALAYAHQRGVIHRDVKPANFLLQPPDRIRLIDLGIAAERDSTRITRGGVGVGTPAFMSPAQLRGEDASAAHDVFGLAATGCFLLSGAPPQRRGPDEAVVIPAAAAASAPLEAALTGALHDRPRTATMAAFLETLAGD